MKNKNLKLHLFYILIIIALISALCFSNFLKIKPIKANNKILKNEIKLKYLNIRNCNHILTKERLSLFDEIEETLENIINNKNDSSINEIYAIKKLKKFHIIIGDTILNEIERLMKENNTDKLIKENIALILENNIISKLEEQNYYEYKWIFDYIVPLNVPNSDFVKVSDCYESKFYLCVYNDETPLKIIIDGDTIKNYEKNQIPVYKCKTLRKGEFKLNANAVFRNNDYPINIPFEVNYTVK